MSEDRNIIRKKIKDGDESMISLIQKYRKNKSKCFCLFLLLIFEKKKSDLQQLQIEIRKTLQKIKPSGKVSQKELNSKEVPKINLRKILYRLIKT